jgi:hypothetical protein
LCLFFKKLVIKAEQDLLGTERGEGGEMTQKMNAHVNK